MTPLVPGWCEVLSIGTIRRALYLSCGNIPSQAANSMQVMKMAQALARRVPEFALVTMGDLLSSMTHRPFDFVSWYGLTEPFSIVRLPLRLWGEYPFQKNQRIKRFMPWAARYAAWRRPDVVFTRSEEVLRRTLSWGMPTVAELHLPFEDTHFLKRWPSLLHHPVLLGIITISPWLAETYTAAGLEEEKVWVLGDGVDFKQFSHLPNISEARCRIGLSLDGPDKIYTTLVLYSGHLYEDRGIEELFLSARKLPDTLFVFVGGWDEEVAHRRRQAEERRLANVRFTGFVPNAKVPLYLAAADILLMPYSRRVNTARWMSPLKVFEYMASGRPIVASRLPAVDRVLTHEKNALLIEPDDAGAIVSAIERLRADGGDLGNRLGAQAVKDVSPYSWDRRAEAILERIAVSLERRSR